MTCPQWCESSVDNKQPRTMLMSHNNVHKYEMTKLPTYVINDDVISTCRTRTPPDNESDVTWHHVIISRVQRSRILTLHIVVIGPIPGAGWPHVEGI